MYNNMDNNMNNYGYNNMQYANNGFNNQNNFTGNVNNPKDNGNIERLKQMFITEKFGADSIMSASMRSFDIGKIVFTFVKFDKNTNRSKQTIDIYMNFEDFYRIYNGLLGNKDYLNQAYKNFKNKGQNAYPLDVNLLQGGTSAQRLQAQGKARPDGKPEYRGLNMNFMLNKNNNGIVFLKAVKGAGKTNPKTNGISLEKQESFIGVSFTKHELSGFLDMCKAHIEAYLNYKVSNIFSKNNNYFK